jgi:hypothetical protein
MSRPQMADTLLQAVVALPNGAATVVSPAIDLYQINPQDDFEARTEFRLTAPALTVGQLANGSTMTYDILGSVNADLSSSTVLVAGFVVQTGAGGAGAAQKIARYNPASDVPRYIGFRATNSAAANASAASATAQLVF